TAMSAEQVGAEAARLCEQGRFPEALRVANDAISENQEGATLHLVRGDILQRWGRCREGLAELLVAESLGLRTSALYLRLWQVALGVGRAADAAGWFSKSLQLDGSRWQAQFGAGSAYQAQGRFSDAIAAYENVLGIVPGNLPSLGNIGVCLI